MAANYGGLLGKLIPESYGLTDQDKNALARQGLLSLGLGILGSRSGGNFGAALSDGLQSGLLAINRGAEDVQGSRYKAQQLANQMGGGTDFRALEAKAKAAGYAPGSEDYQKAFRVALGTEGRASGAGYSFDQEEDANGVPRPARNNPRTGSREIYVAETGQWIPLGGGAQVGQAPAQAGQPQRYIDPLLPQSVQEAIRSGAADNLGEGGFLPIAQVASMPGLGRGRTKEQVAGAVADATNASNLRALSPELSMRTDAALQQEAGKLNVQQAADRTQKAFQRTKDADESINLISEAVQILPKATGSSVGSLVDRAAAAVGRSTPGAEANAQLKIISAGLLAKVPRMEGPQSDKDVQMYREASGDLANENLPVATREAAARQIVRLQRKYASQQGGSAPAQQSSPTRRRYNPATGKIE